MNRLKRKYNRPVPILNEHKDDDVKNDVKDNKPLEKTEENHLDKESIKLDKELVKPDKDCIKSKDDVSKPIKTEEKDRLKKLEKSKIKKSIRNNLEQSNLHLPNRRGNRGVMPNVDKIQLDLTTPSYNILEASNNTYNFYSFNEAFDVDLYKFVLKVFQTGDINIRKRVGSTLQNRTLSFDADNYIETTTYDRAKIGSDSVLVAGDILTFQCKIGTSTKDNFDIAIFVTEVATGTEGNYTVTSSVKTGIMEKPPATTVTGEDETIVSTAFDTLGNAYVIRQKKTLTNVYPFLQIRESNFVTIQPSNKSGGVDGVNPNNNFYSMEQIFNDNNLRYLDSIKNPRMLILPTASEVVLPEYLQML